MTKTALIIGGGFAGCAMAHQFALAGGWDVTLIEAGPMLGSGVRTSWLGGHPYTFGPRHFLTKDPHLFEYLNKYVPLRRCNDHEFLTYVETDAQFYNYPIHIDDIPRMPEKTRIEDELHDRRYHTASGAKNFEDFWMKSIGPTLYRKYIDFYSRKMWQVGSNTLIDDIAYSAKSPKGVTIKSGPRAGWDSAISAYPIAANGYDDYFRIAPDGALIGINMKLGAGDFDPVAKTARLRGVTVSFDVVVSTISPDTLFDYHYGELPFMGRDITTLILPVEYALPEHVYFCYYAGVEPYTRVTEYKKFTRHKSASTLITIEYPSKNGRLYPMPFKAEKERAAKYFALMPDGVFSIGRAGSYDYAIDIDDCIAQAMGVMASLRS